MARLVTEMESILTRMAGVDTDAYFKVLEFEAEFVLDQFKNLNTPEANAKAAAYRETIQSLMTRSEIRLDQILGQKTAVRGLQSISGTWTPAEDAGAVMDRMRDSVTEYFKGRSDFVSMPDWGSDYEAKKKPYTLINVEGIYRLSTPMGDLFWGRSSTSPKVYFGAQSLSVKDTQKLAGIVAALMIHARQKVAPQAPKYNPSEATQLFKSWLSETHNVPFAVWAKMYRDTRKEMYYDWLSRGLEENILAVYPTDEAALSGFAVRSEMRTEGKALMPAEEILKRLKAEGLDQVKAEFSKGDFDKDLGALSAALVDYRGSLQWKPEIISEDIQPISDLVIAVSERMGETRSEMRSAASLEEQTKRAWQATTTDEFLALIHNEYLVDSEKRLQALSPNLIDLDPYFSENIIEPEHLVSEWSREEFLSEKEKKYHADVLYVRSRNNSALGVSKGGIRGLFNYLEKNPQAGEARTASDLMRDPAFRKGLAKLNELDPSEAQAKTFLKTWMEEEAKALSLWMSFKTAVLGIPLGGAKGVFFVGQIRKGPDGKISIEDTELWRDSDKKNIAAVSRPFVRFLKKGGDIGPDIDVPAPDKRTDGVFMGFLTDEFIRLELPEIQKRDHSLYSRLISVYEAERAKHGGEYPATSTALLDESNRYMHEKGTAVPELAVFTGKKLTQGGVAGRPEATGFGVASTRRSLLKAMNVGVRGKTLAIHGAGNVALYDALQAVRDGFIVKVLADEGVTLITEKGFSESEVSELLRRFEENKDKGKMYLIWKEVIDPSEVTIVEGDRVRQAAAALEADVDVLSPNATEGVITEENAPRIKAKFIVPGANGPITPAALKILESRGITVVPDTLTNAGGVMVSYFEQVQALTGHIFTSEEVAIMRERIHQAAFATMWDTAQKRKIHSLTLAADIVSAQRIIRGQYLQLIKQFNGRLSEISKARGHGESEDQLQKQIQASGLEAYLKAIYGQSLQIRVVSPEDEKTLYEALYPAQVIIAGASVGEGKPAFSVSRKMMETLGGGRIIVDTVVDQGGIFEDEEGIPSTTLLQPARIDEWGNLRITVRNLPALFGGVATQLLSQATQALTQELAAGTVPENMSGARSGIVTIQGRFVDEDHPVTEAEFGLLAKADGQKRTIGIPKERLPGETRVGATPEEIKELVATKYTVLVEHGAGAASGIMDKEFEDAGAKIVTREQVWEAGLLRKVKAPLPEEYEYFRPGMIIT
ncbi:MAG: Glu/Leu/Phe/Val dehydrogenase dimerization domain-containing protein, partial [Candidatus Omnitrophica bacterium]|nr:Glu/Leu/Phe/Val dehydrogenase dimerization domain-containing protein [Candidatus Omnitrophota bacterium]